MVGQIKRTRGQAAYRRAADAALKLPVNTVLPAISGDAVEGETLTCSNGTWTNTPDAYAFQWNREGTAIAGAANTRVLTADDVGSTLTCTVTATNLGVSSSATSAPTAVVVEAE